MSEVAERTRKLERLLEFLERDPGNQALRAEVFDAAVGAGRLDVAERELTRALAEHPEDPAWRHRQSMLFLATRRYPEAQQVLEDLLAGGADHPAVQHNLAYSLFAQGRTESAVALLEPLLQRTDAESAVAWVLWLRCQHRLEHFREPLDALRARLAQHPVPVEALGVASIMAVDDGALAEARSWADAALQARPEQLEPLAARGTLALLEQDHASAIGWFQRALQVNPGDGRCWSGVAMAKVMEGDLQEADRAFKNAVATMPDHIGTWIGWGWCQLGLKQPEAARRTFEEALRIDRNFGESHGSLAVALATLGHRDEASQEMELARRLDRAGLSARYAEAILDGRDQDTKVIQRLVGVALTHAHPAARRRRGAETRKPRPRAPRHPDQRAPARCRSSSPARFMASRRPASDSIDASTRSRMPWYAGSFTSRMPNSRATTACKYS